MTPGLCRDCFTPTPAPICPACGSLRTLRHPELFTLAIAHIDCDAFFASVEKRDRPELAGRPVLIGGGTRGVVTAACYVARMYGCRSAMPMFKALKACPDAVVIRPDFAKYGQASRAIRALMQPLSPLVQPLSIDEAVVDLRGTEALHRAPAGRRAGPVRLPGRGGGGADRLHRPGAEPAIGQARRRVGQAARVRRARGGRAGDPGRLARAQAARHRPGAGAAASRTGYHPPRPPAGAGRPRRPRPPRR